MYYSASQIKKKKVITIKIHRNEMKTIYIVFTLQNPSLEIDGGFTVYMYLIWLNLKKMIV